jgi:hypothetical protein
MLYRHEVLWALDFSRLSYEDYDANLGGGWFPDVVSPVETELASINWRPLSNTDLGLPSDGIDANLGSGRFLENNNGSDFIYEYERDIVGAGLDDNAFVAKTGDGKNYGIGFRGTTPLNLEDWISNLEGGIDWSIIAAHFEPLVNAAITTAKDDGADNFYLFGHSRGGAVAEYLYSHFAPQESELGLDFKGAAFASPGVRNGEAGHSQDFVSFERPADRVADITPNNINHVTEQEISKDYGFGRIISNHSLANYQNDIYAESLVPEAMAPELHADDLTLKEPASPAWIGAGESIEVEWTVMNSGGELLDMTNTRLYLSDDAEINDDDRTLESYEVKYWLPARSVKFAAGVTMPEDLIPGDYYIAASVDTDNVVTETVESNNVSNLLEFTVVDPEPDRPDLVARKLSLSEGSSSAGDTLNVNYEIANVGAKQSGTTLSGIFLSTDNKIDTADDQLLASYITELDASEVQVVTDRAIALPDQLAQGDYWIGVVANHDKRAPEEPSLSNNFSDPIKLEVEEPVPDLTVEALAVGPSEIFTGARSDVSWEVRNMGDVASIGSVVNVYISENPNVSSNEDVVASVTVGNIDPGQAKQFDVSPLISSTYDAGQYYFTATVSGSEREVEKDNNSTVVPKTFTNPPEPDIALSNLDMGVEVIEQLVGTIDISLDVTNRGDWHLLQSGYNQLHPDRQLDDIHTIVGIRLYERNENGQWEQIDQKPVDLFYSELGPGETTNAIAGNYSYVFPDWGSFGIQMYSPEAEDAQTRIEEIEVLRPARSINVFPEGVGSDGDYVILDENGQEAVGLKVPSGGTVVMSDNFHSEFSPGAEFKKIAGVNLSGKEQESPERSVKGEDAQFFSVREGALWQTEPLLASMPRDANQDNVYEITLLAEEPGRATATLDLGFAVGDTNTGRPGLPGVVPGNSAYGFGVSSEAYAPTASYGDIARTDTAEGVYIANWLSIKRAVIENGSGVLRELGLEPGRPNNQSELLVSVGEKLYDAGGKPFVLKWFEDDQASVSRPALDSVGLDESELVLTVPGEPPATDARLQYLSETRDEWREADEIPFSEWLAVTEDEYLLNSDWDIETGSDDGGFDVEFINGGGSAYPVMHGGVQIDGPVESTGEEATVRSEGFRTVHSEGFFTVSFFIRPDEVRSETLPSIEFVDRPDVGASETDKPAEVGMAFQLGTGPSADVPAEGDTFTFANVEAGGRSLRTNGLYEDKWHYVELTNDADKGVLRTTIDYFTDGGVEWTSYEYELPYFRDFSFDGVRLQDKTSMTVPTGSGMSIGDVQIKVASGDNAGDEQPQARVFLVGDGNFTLSDSAEVFGRGGDGERVLIAAGARDVAIDGNVDRIDLPVKQSDTTFEVVGGQLQIRTGGDVLARLTGGLNQDVDLRFADGDASLSQTGAGSFALIGVSGSKGTVGSSATTPSLTLGADISATAGGIAPDSPGGSVANVFLQDNASFTIADPAEVFGRGDGQETVRLADTANNVRVDGNIERLEMTRELNAMTFQVTEGQLQISSDGVSVISFTGGLNQGVELQFNNGKGTLSQTGAASFELTGAGEQAQIGASPVTPDIGLVGSSVTDSTSGTEPFGL